MIWASDHQKVSLPHKLHNTYCRLRFFFSPQEHESNAAVTDLELPTAPLDSTDVADADMFEELSRGNGPSIATILNQPAVNDTLEVPEDPIEEIPQIEVQNSETALTVVIDCFPSGNPGTPIPGLPQGPSAYESYQATASDSIWAPFRSQCDWKFVHWAKTCGPTSSAVTELLAMPEVHRDLFFISILYY